MNMLIYQEGLLYTPVRRSRWKFWLPKFVVSGHYYRVGDVVTVFLNSGHVMTCAAGDWHDGSDAFRREMQHNENMRMRRWLATMRVPL